MIAGFVGLSLLFAMAGESPFIVAIDPGHGGSLNLGAPTLRPDVFEKRITLEVARRIRRRFANDPSVRVILCRDSDVLVPIRARVRCANESGARLFLSLHANASPEPQRGEMRGFELYVLSVADVERDAKVAALEAEAATEAVWAAHRIAATAAESLAAARRIEWQLADARGSDQDRGIKQTRETRLDVLQGLRMPGVLVEIGFLDHQEEGAELISEEGWETIATALARGIADVRAREVRGRTDPATTSSRARQRLAAPSSSLKARE